MNQILFCVLRLSLVVLTEITALLSFNFVFHVEGFVIRRSFIPKESKDLHPALRNEGQGIISISFKTPAGLPPLSSEPIDCFTASFLTSDRQDFRIMPHSELFKSVIFSKSLAIDKERADTDALESNLHSLTEHFECFLVNIHFETGSTFETCNLHIDCNRVRKLVSCNTFFKLGFIAAILDAL